MSEIIEGRPPTEEEKRLIALLQELETGQLDFLDEAGKRIIELTTVLLGVLFAVTAFGDKFPPPYLAGNPVAKGLIVLALVLYLGGMVFALWTVQPRDYTVHRYDLDRMRALLRQISQRKAFTLGWAGRFFFSGSVVLALLVTWLVVGA